MYTLFTYTTEYKITHYLKESDSKFPFIKDIHLHTFDDNTLIVLDKQALILYVGTWVQSLSWEDPLEKRKSIHSSILAWRIPWTV